MTTGSREPWLPHHHCLLRRVSLLSHLSPLGPGHQRGWDAWDARDTCGTNHSVDPGHVPQRVCPRKQTSPASASKSTKHPNEKRRSL